MSSTGAASRGVVPRARGRTDSYPGVSGQRCRACRGIPSCHRPADLVRPVRTDPSGTDGPTRNQARGPYWKQTSSGMYVPSSVDSTVVEQRILEQGSRIPGYGAVTGWAALRWHGATYFDGTGYDGELLPVPLILHDGIRPDPRFTQTESQLACTERMRGRRAARDDGAARVVRRGTADPQRSRVGGGDRHGGGRPADLCASVRDVRRPAERVGPASRTLARRLPWLGTTAARRRNTAWCWCGCSTPVSIRRCATARCSTSTAGSSASRTCWTSRPGLVGEYQGEDHKDGARHRKDVEREERFRDHGLEFFELVGGDIARRHVAVNRMLSARRRAKFLPPESRAWTLEPPPWRSRPETVDEYLVRTGRADALWRT